MDGMLRRLRIDNLVLIREAELELDAGLNAITGETGAGKTILANAFGLLLGARGDAAAIGAAAGEAYVEAEFDLPDDETALAAETVLDGMRRGLSGKDLVTGSKLNVLLRPGSPEEFSAFVAKETPVWTEMVRESGATAQ